MKTQVLSREIASLSIIGFLLLVIITSLGCGILSILSNAYPVMRLDPVLLTQEDLPMMRLTESDRLGGFPKESSLIVGFDQQWSDGHLVVRYYLFDASYTAKKAKANPRGHTIATPANYQPELNPTDVIGDATWHLIPRRHWEKGMTDIYFVKNNVGVHVMKKGTSEYQLQFVRDVARKIEAKIAAVLEKK
ncbi:hypothetical protein C6500_17515 [Candidatus Poribacteria bacterium]|nr:MAG: hypothetical protein C6500_17515 [Candidatus Poribacteria bacterium]